MDGCDRTAVAKGLCRPHYTAQRHAASPKPTCLADGCNNKSVTFKWQLCGKHYKTRVADGRQMVVASESMSDRLDAQSVPRPSGCVEWIGHLNAPNGYGRISVDGKMRLAHHMAWMLWNDATEIPDGCVIRHSCDNTLCINPLHLVSGTRSDNTYDSLAVGTHSVQILSRNLAVRLRDVMARHQIDPGVIESVVVDMRRGATW